MSFSFLLLLRTHTWSNIWRRFVIWEVTCGEIKERLIFFWRVLKESLVPGFKSLFMQESPSVSVSVMLNPMPTQSRPLTGFSSVICANVSWQLAQHGAALTGPLHDPAGRRGPSLEEGATTCYMAITLTRGQGHRPTLQRPQHPPSVAVETAARLDSSRRIGFATPMGVWNERRGGFGGEIGRLVEERSSEAFTADKEQGKYHVFSYCNNLLHARYKAWRLKAPLDDHVPQESFKLRLLITKI